MEELTPAAAQELLQTLAPKAWEADPKAAEALLAAVGYLPLAIELLGGYLNAGAAGRFAAHSGSALADLTDPARRLHLATRRLGSHESAAVTLHDTIALSLEGLREEAPLAVDAFYSLGAFAPKPATFDLAAALAVLGESGDAETLALLADRNLLEIDEDETLALHQTLADVARDGDSRGSARCPREHYLAQVNEDRQNWQAIEAIYPQISRAWQWQNEANSARGGVASACLVVATLPRTAWAMA